MACGTKDSKVGVWQKKKGGLLTERERGNKGECMGSKQEGEYKEGHGQTWGAMAVTGLGMARPTGT